MNAIQIMGQIATAFDKLTEQERQAIIENEKTSQTMAKHEVYKQLKHIVFWRDGSLTCEQEVEKLLHEANYIESKDEKVLSAIKGR